MSTNLQRIESEIRSARALIESDADHFSAQRPIRNEVLGGHGLEHAQALMLFALHDRAVEQAAAYEHTTVKHSECLRECHEQIATQQREIWQLRDDLARALREAGG